MLRDSARELRTLAPALPSAGAAAAAELADRAIRALPEHATALPEGMTVRNGLVERTEEAYNSITEAPGDDVSADEVDIENQPKAATREKADDGPWFYTKKYAYPRLNSREWDLLNYTMNSEIESTDQYLDAWTKWLYSDQKGTQVFALYGIGDGTDPTPLYAVGGKRAVADYNRLMKFLEGGQNGNNKDRAIADRLFGEFESK